MEKVNINEKFGLIKDLWTPKIIGELNGKDLKLAKVKVEFVWQNIRFAFGVKVLVLILGALVSSNGMLGFQ